MGSAASRGAGSGSPRSSRAVPPGSVSPSRLSLDGESRTHRAVPVRRALSRPTPSPCPVLYRTALSHLPPAAVITLARRTFVIRPDCHCVLISCTRSQKAAAHYVIRRAGSRKGGISRQHTHVTSAGPLGEGGIPMPHS